MNPVERRPSELKNKHKREALYQKQKLEKQKAKHKKRKERAKVEEKNPELKKKRLEENVPKTLDNTREADETMLDQPDDEVAQDEAMDELASYFSGKTPKILVTTSKKCSTNCYDFCAELVSMFPDAQFAKRGPKHELRQVIKIAKEKEFTDLIIVNEDRKIPNAITLIHLPDGPTAYFKLSSYVPSKAIVNHGKVTAHNPELILNNFNTRLGHTVGRMFQALLPQVPEFQGRQVITFHNQRDFIFVRRHRYVFRDTEKVGLQELGPRFTLKLRWLQKGVYQRDGEYEWMFKPELETSRKKFFL
ncbi:Brix-domain-containing protein [Rhizopus microsporus ATCC 52813]|uniref:Brix-domain-containing protein n=2 Tax=Rhizopus microsporus TaxID=58291 RepID=A0A2G4SVQ9_RHIZD|nr:Brix-domain-containing protein [Rhizopus microsporus ATCC 52813]PHZ12860.1 Brix-domain-containing protein [Rhizopus microsporus ATCC 52813]